MLDRILEIRNLGRFEKCKGEKNELRFDRLTVVYAENGRGKTTLVAALRSASTGDPVHILGRRRLGSTTAPHVTLRLTDKRKPRFDGAAWSGASNPTFVFDDLFVAENVCTGLQVTLDNRRKFHKVIIGQEGVRLATALDKYSELIRKQSSVARLLEADIRPHIHGKMAVAEFCALKEARDIDAKILSATQNLSAARSADAIRKTALFHKISLPPFDPSKLEALLATTIDSLGAEARRQVEDHVRSLGGGALDWLLQGFQYGRVDTCPYCDQGIKDTTLIPSYHAYFSDAVQRLKERLSAARGYGNSTFGDDRRSAATTALKAEEAKRVFWGAHVDGLDDELKYATAIDLWERLTPRLMAALTTKVESPLDAVNLDDDLRDDLTAYSKAARLVNRSSEALVAMNEAIEKLRTAIKGKDISTLERDLEALKNGKRRKDKSVAESCEKFISNAEQQASARDKKADTREKLDAYSESVFGKYRKSINKILDNFGARFTLGTLKQAHEGGKTGSQFDLVLEGVPVKLTGKPHMPTFANTLSAGDRTTLALAFFLAQFDTSADPSKSTVVFDDPISSLDAGRRTSTCQVACHLATRGAQVIVLSHDALFLHDVWCEAHGSEKNSIAIVAGESGTSVLEEWNVLTEVDSSFHKKRAAIGDYVDGVAGAASAEHVAGYLRLVLEGYLRVVDADRMGRTDWLGTYIEKVRAELDAGTETFLTEHRHTELGHLSAYARKWHHDTSPTGTVGPVNEQELGTYAARTLKWLLPTRDPR